MDSTIARRSAIAALLTVSMVASGALSVPAFAANVTVVVNGQTVSFDQPPVERAGRVFVPLRGVFERLGASVVYANGTINATGNGRNISLRIGSTQATVNGQTQYLDVAPFLVGARTLVPLRFVAQALGAAVDWNNGTSTVTITGGSGGGGNNQPANTPPPNRSFYLQNQRPGVDASVGTLTPAIHASFSEPVQQNSVHVSIDGRDVTNDVYINANGFDVTPSFQLPAGTHRVRVTGNTQAGASFETGWKFTTGGSASATENYIRNIQPGAGSRVSSNFNFSGRTIPGSQVRIVASGEANVFGGIFQVGTGAYQTTATADGNGVFSAAIQLNNVSGSQVRVLVQSIAPNGSSVERTFTYSM